MVILVCGLITEEPIKLLIEALDDLGAEYHLIELEALCAKVSLRWQLCDQGISGHLKIDGDVLDIQDINGVYHRFVNPEEIHSSLKEVSRCRSIIHSLLDLFDVLPARVVNRRRPMMSNNSKPYQSLLIRNAGFSIPDTIITNNPSTVMEYAAWNAPLIYKSISSVRSIVESLDAESASRLKSIMNLPTQFQKKINGFNLRVHVIGEEAIGTRITTSAIDYRYAAQQGSSSNFKAYELPLNLTENCVKLAKLLQLDFVGIDLMVNEDNVYCLEVNPSPGYSYYQKYTGQRISEVLADYLMKA